MKLKIIAMTLTLSTGLLINGAIAVAQHEQHHSDQAPADNHEAIPGKMPQIMTAQQEVSTLADQLLKSFARIENEKDPAVLSKQLAEHGALLKELETKIQGQSQMMEKMRGEMMMMGRMMGGSTMGNEKKKP